MNQQDFFIFYDSKWLKEKLHYFFKKFSVTEALVKFWNITQPYTGFIVCLCLLYTYTTHLLFASLMLKPQYVKLKGSEDSKASVLAVFTPAFRTADL